MSEIDKMLNGDIKSDELSIIRSKGINPEVFLITEKKPYSVLFTDSEPNDGTMPIPQHNDSLLTAFDKLNENVLHALISGYPQDKQLSMVSMSIQEIADHESAAKSLKECFDLSHPKFVHFEERQEFWRTFKLHMESRQKYVSKLMY